MIFGNALLAALEVVGAVLIGWCKLMSYLGGLALLLVSDAEIWVNDRFVRPYTYQKTSALECSNARRPDRPACAKPTAAESGDAKADLPGAAD